MCDCVPFYGTRQSIANFQFVAFDATHPWRTSPDIQPRLTGHLLQGRSKDILVDSDSYQMEVCQYSNLEQKSKAERNQNMANAFHQGGHTQTAIALAVDVSSSTVSRVIKEFEMGA